MCKPPAPHIHTEPRPPVPQVRALLPEIEAALAPFGARPHWGKISCAGAGVIAACYPRLPAFLALRRRLDPSAKFGNAYLEGLGLLA